MHGLVVGAQLAGKLTRHQVAGCCPQCILHKSYGIAAASRTDSSHINRNCHPLRFKSLKLSHRREVVIPRLEVLIFARNHKFLGIDMLEAEIHWLRGLRLTLSFGVSQALSQSLEGP